MMSFTRFGLYVFLFVVISSRLQVASGARKGTYWSNDFYTIASRVKTDKVNSHHYEALYDNYLQPIAGEKLRLLESKNLFLAIRGYLCMKETARDL